MSNTGWGFFCGPGYSVITKLGGRQTSTQSEAWAWRHGKSDGTKRSAALDLLLTTEPGTRSWLVNGAATWDGASTKRCSFMVAGPSLTVFPFSSSAPGPGAKDPGNTLAISCSTLIAITSMQQSDLEV